MERVGEMRLKIYWLNLRLFLVRLPAWIKFPLHFFLLCLYICFLFRLYALFTLVFTPAFGEWVDFFLFLVAVSVVIAWGRGSK